MDYLVTGGAGFIGSNIAEHLVGLGHRVRIFDNFSSGKRTNVQTFADKVEIVEGDLRDPKAVAHAVNGVRFVLHLGAMPSVIRWLWPHSRMKAVTATLGGGSATTCRGRGTELG